MVRCVCGRSARLSYLFQMLGWWIVPWAGMALGPPLIAVWLLGHRIAPTTLSPSVRYVILIGCAAGMVKVWVSHGMPALLHVTGNLQGLWPAT